MKIIKRTIITIILSPFLILVLVTDFLLDEKEGLDFIRFIWK